jgi:hypothetical protein
MDEAEVDAVFAGWNRGDPIGYIRDRAPEHALPSYSGARYEALVPDTLDLQERAALGVHGLTAPTDPAADYEIYVYASFAAHPPLLQHDNGDRVQAKFMEALPLLRLMSGSDLNGHVEAKWLEVLLRMQGPDGLPYWPLRGRPWFKLLVWGLPLPDSDQVTVALDIGRLLGCVTAYYRLTGENVWLETGKRIVDGLRGIMVDRGRDGYFPKCQFGLGERAGAGAPEPDPLHAGVCGAGWTCDGLGKFYRATGYEPARAIAEKLSRYIMEHYYGPGVNFLPENPRRPNWVHFHSHVTALLGMMELASGTGDEERMAFARRGYEYAKLDSDTLMGFFPENYASPRLETSEICEVAQIIALGLKLTEAGVADCWDEVDRWTRNMLAQGQLRRTDWIGRMSRAGLRGRARPRPTLVDQRYQTTDRAAERCLGAFAGWPSPNDWFIGQGVGIMNCCTGNGTRALYYVWENILHHEGGKLRVNLLLNRASPWADVDSHIPYVGQVDVRIKEGVKLSLRIPEWVAPAQVRVRVNDGDREVGWNGRYAQVGGVKPDDVVTVTFPIAERTDEVWIQKERYTLVRKGNEIVSIDPPGRYHPLFQRDHYRENSTRWRNIERFVAEDSIYY